MPCLGKSRKKHKIYHPNNHESIKQGYFPSPIKEDSKKISDETRIPPLSKQDYTKNGVKNPIRNKAVPQCFFLSRKKGCFFLKNDLYL